MQANLLDQPPRIRAMICSMKFFSLEISFQLCKSIQTGAYINTRNRYVGLLVFQLLPLLNPWLVFKMQPMYVFSKDITLVNAYLNWLRGFHFLILTHYYSLNDFSNEDVDNNSFLPPTARLQNSLTAECFPFTYDLNGCKSRINRHLFLWVLSKKLSYKG